MILLAVIAAAIGGLIAGLELPLLLLPVIYVSKIKEKRDLFILLFSVYGLAIGYELEVANLYSADFVKVLSVMVPSLLLLDSGLSSSLRSWQGLEEGKRRRRFTQLPFATLIGFSVSFVIGWYIREIFVVAVLVALMYEFSKDNERGFGVFAAVFCFSLFITVIVFGQGLLNLEGAAATQAVFIAAVSTLIALVFFWRKRDRVEFAPLVLVYR